MKKTVQLLCILCIVNLPSFAQQKIENIIVITTDGLRWQEVFGGMDTAIARSKRFNQNDSNYLFKEYWSADIEQRRKKLMPFFWNTLAQAGQIHGNRWKNNFVNVRNPHWFSYPGYSELLTGFADERINSNDYPPNPHTTVLEFLHARPLYKNKVVAFGAWHAFDRIINEQRAGFPVYSAFDKVSSKKLTPEQHTINKMLEDSHRPWHDHECLDVFTHFSAMEYIKANTPKIVYIAYGETDEWAHAGRYRFYLDAARQFDKWVGEIWNYVQKHPVYKNKTALLISTDHGRGDIDKTKWTDHGKDIPGADQIWFAVIGPGISATGEATTATQVYQEQFAKTIAHLLGIDFKPKHPVAERVKGL